MRGGAALAVAVLLSVPSVVAADDTSAWVAKWGDTLRRREFTEAEKLLQEIPVDALAKKPEDALQAVRLAARYFPAGVRSGMNTSGIEASFEKVAKASEAAEATTPAISRVVAATYGLKCRLAGAADLGVSPEDLSALATRTLESYDLPGGGADQGRAFADAAGWIRSAMFSASADKAAALSALETLVEKAGTQATGENLALFKGELEFARAVAAEATPAQAGKPMAACLAALSAIAATSTSDVVASTHTEAVTYARKHKLGSNPPYRTKPKAAGMLRLDCPVGESWTSPKEAKGFDIALDHGDRFGRPMGAIRIQRFPKGNSIEGQGGTKIPVEDLKAMAKHLMDADVPKFDEGATNKGPGTQKVGKLKPGQGYEITGAQSGRAVNQRVVCAKGDSGDTYAIHMTLEGEGAKDDPEFDAVVASIVEKK